MGLISCSLLYFSSQLPANLHTQQCSKYSVIPLPKKQPNALTCSSGPKLISQDWSTLPDTAILRLFLTSTWTGIRLHVFVPKPSAACAFQLEKCLCVGARSFLRPERSMHNYLIWCGHWRWVGNKIPPHKMRIQCHSKTASFLGPWLRRSSGEAPPQWPGPWPSAWRLSASETSPVPGPDSLMLSSWYTPVCWGPEGPGARSIMHLSISTCTCPLCILIHALDI